MPQPVDLRGLDPPEPLMRIIAALEADPVGPLIFLMPREPWPLDPLLRRGGWRHAIKAREDGWELVVYRDSSVP